tara:strand:+ start:48 stop:503 length:456 start_codon:yes stop_codon:yes gene_type:complete
MANRDYTSRRSNILNALATKLKDIDGSGAFLTDVANNVETRLKFWDEVQDFPAIHLNAGTETRDYQAGGYKDRYLSITIRCYVSDDTDSTEALNLLMEDVETVVEDNSRLKYYDAMNNEYNAQQITVVSIVTDEGVLDPLGVGEIEIEVRY